METLDIELSELATKLVGRDVEVIWNDSELWEGRAVTGSHNYIVELNRSLKRAGSAYRLSTVLHELAHLHLGHNMTPERLRKSRYAKTPTAKLQASDTGTSMHLRREMEAWTQAAAWAMTMNRRDVAQHCKRRRDADIMAWVQIELGKMDERLTRLENRR